MKIGIDIGHNCPYDTGAVAIRNEDELNKEVGTKVIEKLILLGHTVINCTPTTASSLYDSLQYRVDTANKNYVELFVSIHFNSGGGNGTEVYSAGLSGTGFNYGQKVLKEIVALGFINRGVRDGSSFYVIRNTVAPAILIECAFLDSSADMFRYNGENMATAIVKGITGIVSIVSPPIVPAVSSDALKLQQGLNRLRVTDTKGNRLIEDGLMGPKTESAIKRFQAIEGLVVDGIGGTDTWNGINTIFYKPLLSLSLQNNLATRYVQWRVGAAIDGIFGSATDNAVKNYQIINGLEADGIVGENTWYKLIG